MASNKWTTEQKNAISVSGNLLVSAAAGAGKTAVLTERILRIISEGTKIDEFLVVTFTNLAAAEMKERIEKRLNELAFETEDKELSRRMINAASNIYKSDFSTIHAFCKNVLKRNYHKVGLDPAFKIADNMECSVLIDRAMSETIEEFLFEVEEKRDDASLFIIDALNRKGGIETAVMKIYYFVIARPDPIGFLKNACDNYDEGFNAVLQTALKEFLIYIKRKTAILYERADELYLTNFGIEKESEVKANIAHNMQNLVALGQITSYDEMYKALLGIEFKNSKGVDPDEVVKLYKAMNDFLKELKEIFALSFDEEKALHKCLKPVIEKLALITERFIKRYDEYKRDECLVDFNDLEQLALAALMDDETADEYKQKFKYIFVDEYQDTNLVQDSIISRISRGNNVFMVGDVKQSIYRFRQAEPEVFLEKYRAYMPIRNEKIDETEENSADGKQEFRIDLNTNFRSTTSVLNAVNALFYQLMRGEFGEIDYSDNAELVAKDDQKSGYVELDLIELKQEVFNDIEQGSKEDDKQDAKQDDGANNSDDGQSGNNDEAFDELERIEAEGSFIADKIMELMENTTVFDKEKKEIRKPVFSDFAILMRSLKASAVKLCNNLAARGIPSIALIDEGYFNAIEVQIFINLLRIIDNTRQDIPLASVLRSQIGGFDDIMLARLKSETDGNDFCEHLYAAAVGSLKNGEKDENLVEKSRNFIRKLNRWKKLAHYMRISEFIGTLIDETRYGIYVSALPNGAIRRENINMLIDHARAFEASGGRSLNGFINRLDISKKSGQTAMAQQSNQNAVSIMSIHKSKGLEFPIVFISSLSAKINKRDMSAVVMMDRDIGIGLSVSTGFYRLKEIDPSCFKKSGCGILRRAMETKVNNKLLSEEMRVLYVAMTRARERLYLVAAKKDMPKLVEKQAKRLSETSVMSASCYLDWILGAYFPLGLNLSNAIKGIETPVNNDTLYTYYYNSKSNKAENSSMNKEQFYSWLSSVEKTEHDDIDASASFKYPYAEETTIPSRASAASAFAIGEHEYEPAIPIFLREKKALTGAQRGTATHKLIMLLENRLYSLEEIENRLALLTKQGFFTSREAEAVNVHSIEKLVASPLYSRILKSEKVYKEQQFSIITETGALSQGILDCFFIENGSAVIVDYKTTALRGKSAEETAYSYKPQLAAYKTAVEQLTGYKVSEIWIYLLSTDQAIKVD